MGRNQPLPAILLREHRTVTYVSVQVDETRRPDGAPTWFVFRPTRVDTLTRRRGLECVRAGRPRRKRHEPERERIP